MTTELEVCQYPGCHDEARIAGYCLEHAEIVLLEYDEYKKSGIIQEVIELREFRKAVLELIDEHKEESHE